MKTPTSFKNIAAVNKVAVDLSDCEPRARENGAHFLCIRGGINPAHKASVVATMNQDGRIYFNIKSKKTGKPRAISLDKISVSKSLLDDKGRLSITRMAGLIAEKGFAYSAKA